MRTTTKTGEIIEKLGGQVALAKRLGVERMTVFYWVTQGIPARYWRWIVSEGVATWEELAKMKVESIEAKNKDKKI